MSNNFIVSLQDISISFDGENILNNFNLNIKDGEFVTLLGPSGCGKTTTLRIIGGFVMPDSGDVFFEGKKITTLPAHKRQVNTIFQKYALFPHLNVYENVAFGMRIQKKSEEEIRETVKEMLSMVNLSGYEKRKVTSLSGGQQQRIAIARALANRPKVLLLDEPSMGLSPLLVKEVFAIIKEIHRAGITVLLNEQNARMALSIADRAYVLETGKISISGDAGELLNDERVKKAYLGQ